MDERFFYPKRSSLPKAKEFTNVFLISFYQYTNQESVRLLSMTGKLYNGDMSIEQAVKKSAIPSRIRASSQRCCTLHRRRNVKMIFTVILVLLLIGLFHPQLLHSEESNSNLVPISVKEQSSLLLKSTGPEKFKDLFNPQSAPSRVRFLPAAESLGVPLTVPDFPDLGPKRFSNESNNAIEFLLRDEYDYSNRVADSMKSLVQKYPYLEHARANAVIFVLCRNSDLNGILASMREFEETFNSRYNYPYLFVNNEDFSSEFQTGIRHATKSNFTFAKLPHELWSVPADIDLVTFGNRLHAMAGQGLAYGGSASYRHMCRFFSRLFYKVKELAPYRYYWRLEPDVNFRCKMRYDPLLYMALAKKVFAYTIVGNEDIRVVRNLWNHTMAFMQEKKIPVSDFMTEAFYNPEIKDFNGNHYWSNFEIADLEFYRSKIYEEYMVRLDESKGFFYERYGDAPIHSLAVGMLLRPKDLHYFGDIAYAHMSMHSCPVEDGPNAPYPFFSELCSCHRDHLWVDSLDFGWKWGKNFKSLQLANNRHWNMSVRPLPAEGA